jgi:hypothetical protein
MEAVRQENTILSREDRICLLKEHLSGPLLRIETAPSVIADLFGFLSEQESSPSVVVHLPLSALGNISSAVVSEAYLSTVRSPNELVPHSDLKVPHSLLGRHWIQRHPSRGLTVERETISWQGFEVPVSRCALPNGLRVSAADTTLVRDGKTIVRLSLPLATNGSTSSETLLALAAKTIGEGGAMGTFCSDQIEQWCLDRNIGVVVTLDSAPDQIVIQIETPTTELRSSKKKLHSLLEVSSSLLSA